MAKNFQLAIAQLKKFIADGANGNYRVIGFGKQAKNTAGFEGIKQVQVFHAGGSFDRSTGKVTGEQTYVCSAVCRLTVAEPATCDLSVIDDPDSTNEERIQALIENSEAEERADLAIDDLFGMLFDLIMGGDGRDFGTVTNTIQISDRFGEDFKKELPQKVGSLVTINGYFTITFRVLEIPQGETPKNLESILGSVDLQSGIDDLQILTGE